MAENSHHQPTTRKATKGSFKPGKSGNPGGRPKEVREVVDLARQHTTEAIERLVYWMKSNNPQASVKATESLIERGWGKPVQPMELSNKEGEALRLDATIRAMPLEDLESLLAMYEKLGIKGAK